eukprot:Rhum_TRINITY_DN17378_c0_g1::Rhum_TRINITY_DN17378_c0_g1_i1::g.165866::m.165866
MLTRKPSPFLLRLDIVADHLGRGCRVELLHLCEQTLVSLDVLPLSFAVEDVRLLVLRDPLSPGTGMDTDLCDTKRPLRIADGHPQVPFHRLHVLLVEGKERNLHQRTHKRLVQPFRLQTHDHRLKEAKRLFVPRRVTLALVRPLLLGRPLQVLHLPLEQHNLREQQRVPAHHRKRQVLPRHPLVGLVRHVHLRKLLVPSLQRRLLLADRLTHAVPLFLGHLLRSLPLLKPLLVRLQAVLRRLLHHLVLQRLACGVRHVVQRDLLAQHLLQPVLPLLIVLPEERRRLPPVPQAPHNLLLGHKHDRAHRSPGRRRAGLLRRLLGLRFPLLPLRRPLRIQCRLLLVVLLDACRLQHRPRHHLHLRRARRCLAGAGGGRSCRRLCGLFLGTLLLHRLP